MNSGHLSQLLEQERERFGAPGLAVAVVADGAPQSAAPDRGAVHDPEPAG
jgi:hypothetical protein